jgi:hypothetical protein
MFIPNLYMFRALMCSSSGELIVSIRHLVLFFLLRYVPLHNVTLHARFVLIHVCKISFKVIICFCLFEAHDFTVFQSLWSLQTLRIVLSIFSLGHFSELASHLRTTSDICHSM